LEALAEDLAAELILLLSEEALADIERSRT
jgi:hypothetical protein